MPIPDHTSNPASPVRQGEELNDSNLLEFLQSNLAGDLGSIRVSQFPAGSSNLTYLIQIDSCEYVLRRPPYGNTVRSAHDMKREYDVLSKLSRVYKPAPKPLLFCNDETVIGSKFYIMERRHGVVLRGSVTRVSSPHVSKGSLATEERLSNLHLSTSQPYRERVCRSFIQNLADLHALDYEAAGLADLGKPEGYCRRQVEGWTRRYLAAKTGEFPELERTIGWLNVNIPPESGAAVVHNDYKFDNIMLDPDDLTKITAVLDWEMVTIGDPLMDLGTTLGYWMSSDAGEEMLDKPFNPRVLMSNISRQEIVEMYAEASGRDVSNIVFHYVFGTFKIAVIAQQIYSRFAKGFTQDVRFAHFDKFVASLGRIAANAIEQKSL
ncbi:MAG: phosphotransferase family protein [Pyrinomonadaceae bacterium]